MKKIRGNMRETSGKIGKIDEAFYLAHPEVRGERLMATALQNLVSHARSALPSTAQLRNYLPTQISTIRSRANFRREVNRFLDATWLAASEKYFVSVVYAQLWLTSRG